MVYIFYLTVSLRIAEDLAKRLTNMKLIIGHGKFNNWEKNPKKRYRHWEKAPKIIFKSFLKK